MEPNRPSRQIRHTDLVADIRSRDKGSSGRSLTVRGSSIKPNLTSVQTSKPSIRNIEIGIILRTKRNNRSPAACEAINNLTHDKQLHKPLNVEERV